MKKLLKALNETGIIYAYHHFAEGEAPGTPFICYTLPNSDNFSADGTVYKKITAVSVELYTDKKDLCAEAKVEEALKNNGFFYNKSETWIQSELLYEIIYNFEMEA